MGQKYGQHFLRDQSVLEQTINVINQQIQYYQCNSLIEIGPGKWALTKYLAQIDLPQTLFEIDTSLAGFLQAWTSKYPHQQVQRGDFLQYDIGGFDASSTLVVGNLPYYITSPILRKCFVDASFIGGAFLIQRDVAEKIITTAKKKSYLWRLLNYQYTVTLVCKVPGSAFDPPPKVRSAVISVDRAIVNRPFTLTHMQECLDLISRYKRKTIGKSLVMAGISKDRIAWLSWDILSKRLEACTRADMAALIAVVAPD